MPTPDFNPAMPFLTAGDRERHSNHAHRERLRDLRNNIHVLEGSAEKRPLTQRESVTLKCLRIQLRTETPPADEPQAPHPRGRLCIFRP